MFPYGDLYNPLLNLETELALDFEIGAWITGVRRQRSKKNEDLV